MMWFWNQQEIPELGTLNAKVMQNCQKSVFSDKICTKSVFWWNDNFKQV